MRIELQEACRAPQMLGTLFKAPPKRIGAPPALIAGIATDSREVQRGDLFVARAGECADGHDFIAAALQAGAYGILCEKHVPLPKGDFWLFVCESAQNALLRAAHAWREQCGARVIAVTGSAGKTTTKEAIAAVLGDVPHNAGNYNSTMGMPLSVLSFPPADFWVCELGINHVGEMEPMSRALSPDLCVVTNVGSAHIGNFGDLFTLLREKASVACGLKSGGSVLVPFPLKNAGFLMPSRHIFGVGEEKTADFVTENIAMSVDGTRCDLCGKDTVITNLTWPIPGGIGRSVIGLAGACGLLCGKNEHDIREGLERAGKSTPRLRRFAIGERLLIEDVYNASPEACTAALETVRYLGGARPVVAILGDMLELGGYSGFLHRALGAAVQRSGCAMLISYGALAAQIAVGAREAGMEPRRIFSFAADEEAAVAECALTHAPRDAVMLCKGSRAMRMERVVARIRRSL